MSFRMNIPRHLLTIDDAEILKKVVLHSVATALASIVWKKKELKIWLHLNEYSINLNEQYPTGNLS